MNSRDYNSASNATDGTNSETPGTAASDADNFENPVTSDTAVSDDMDSENSNTQVNADSDLNDFDNPEASDDMDGDDFSTQDSQDSEQSYGNSENLETSFAAASDDMDGDDSITQDSQDSEQSYCNSENLETSFAAASDDMDGDDFNTQDIQDSEESYCNSEKPEISSPVTSDGMKRNDFNTQDSQDSEESLCYYEEPDISYSATSEGMEQNDFNTQDSQDSYCNSENLETSYPAASDEMNDDNFNIQDSQDSEELNCNSENPETSFAAASDDMYNNCPTTHYAACVAIPDMRTKSPDTAASEINTAYSTDIGESSNFDSRPNEEFVYNVGTGSKNFGMQTNNVVRNIKSEPVEEEIVEDSSFLYNNPEEPNVYSHISIKQEPVEYPETNNDYNQSYASSSYSQNLNDYKTAEMAQYLPNANQSPFLETNQETYSYRAPFIKQEPVDDTDYVSMYPINVKLEPKDVDEEFNNENYTAVPDEDIRHALVNIKVEPMNYEDEDQNINNSIMHEYNPYGHSFQWQQHYNNYDEFRQLPPPPPPAVNIRREMIQKKKKKLQRNFIQKRRHEMTGANFGRRLALRKRGEFQPGHVRSSTSRPSATVTSADLKHEDEVFLNAPVQQKEYDNVETPIEAEIKTNDEPTETLAEDVRLTKVPLTAISTVKHTSTKEICYDEETANNNEPQVAAYVEDDLGTKDKVFTAELSEPKHCVEIQENVGTTTSSSQSIPYLSTELQIHHPCDSAQNF